MRAVGAVALLGVLVLLCVATQADVQTPCQEGGLAAFWKFDEGQGDIAFDLCGNSNGTIHGATWAGGKANGALFFDGVDDYVDFGNPEALLITQEITVLMWIRVERQTVEAYELLHRPGTFTLYLYQRSETCRVMGAVAIGGQNSYPQGKSELTYGRWCHVGFVFGVFDGSGIKKLGNIVDGQVVRSAPLDGSMAVTDTSLLLNPRRLHRVTVDELRVYDRALTPQEIQDVYLTALSEEEVRVRRETSPSWIVVLYRDNPVVVAAISTIPFLFGIVVILRRVLRAQHNGR